MKTATFMSYFAAFSVTAAAASALADPPATACVALADDDALAVDDQRGAMTMLRQTFRAHGVQVVEEGCEATYTITHVRLGQAVFVTLEGPFGIMDHRAQEVEELPAVYDQLVGAALNGGTLAQATDRTNVTLAQDDPRRVQSDNLFYFRLGYGYGHGAQGFGGPAFGLGYRYELDRAAIDLGLANLVVSDSDHEDGVSGTIVRLAGYYFFNGTANQSPYLGGGIGWGISNPNGEAYDSGEDYWTGPSYYGSGLAVDVSGGWEFLRASTIRMFVQGDVSLPTYKAQLNSWYDETVGTPASDVWAPTFSVSLGMGFSRGGRRGR